MKTRALATQRKSTRRGFTLVELLVVITIIGILAGLALVAIPAAVGRVKEGAMTAELVQMETAMKLFRNDYGAYPPDGNAAYYPTNGVREARFQSFFKKLFPRINSQDYDDALDSSDTGEKQQIQNLVDAGIVSPAILTGTLSLDNISPPEILVICLSGFSSDIEYPLTGSSERKRYFDFKPERLQDKDGDGWYEYYPSGVDAPYVYFDSRSYVTGAGAAARFPASTSSAFPGIGQARPYYQILGSTSGFANPDTFQIICAGIDGSFGEWDDYAVTNTDVKVYPGGLAGATLPSSLTAYAYTTDDRDNITNFAQGPLRNKEPE
ncbi:prepilin-type N-terminal cleavage/methylation domain-containing protein [Blastopirellula marina]|uniref:Uncharacterized protein n=1 Tax=Blastopirellula marina DSM 3645 TaxID=314230 RepID=A3ZTU6_9BACT|nr:type II secretion system protein [Blastopirellula marina]EAQ80003.1 hypothetical protein DSM3645_05255 [Blastopirellula marina DSM 3645]